MIFNLCNGKDFTKELPHFTFGAGGTTYTNEGEAKSVAGVYELTKDGTNGTQTNWTLKLLKSGTLTPTRATSKIDVGCVGAGGNGGGGWPQGGGAGGRGGEVKVSYGISVTRDSTYNITVGTNQGNTVAFGVTASGAAGAAGGAGGTSSGNYGSSNADPGVNGTSIFGSSILYGAGGGGGAGEYDGVVGWAAAGGVTGGGAGGSSGNGGDGSAPGAGGGGSNNWGGSPGNGAAGIVIIRNAR